MKRRNSVLFTVLFLLLSNYLFGQEKLFSSVKLGVGTAACRPVEIYEFSKKEYHDVKPAIRLEGDCELFDNFKTGVYWSYAKIFHNDKEWYFVYNDRQYEIGYARSVSDSFYYGLKFTYHSLPDELELRLPLGFDAYYGLCLGVATELWENVESKKMAISFFEYSICIGVSYMFTYAIGIYGEYSFGSFYNKTHHRGQIGIMYQFQSK
ncbi:hypothetical protein D0T49_05220 [Paludibacter sp. 221]|uniref:hypothetical protein n=1 Tax=Paludibacter sp. 221 TaxID=2302939 RepID=UPI0013D86CEA|nr:hypothetical protein [Paludibacter sp. 221]NDV46440.1 hypothetical protein [Paludibacter sp. 221]